MIKRISFTYKADCYYKKQKQQRPQDLSFGLYYLDPQKGLKEINDILHYYHHCHQQGIIKKETANTLTTLKKSYQRKPNAMTKLRLMMSKLRAESDLKRYEWYDNNHTYLKKDESWVKIKKLALDYALKKHANSEKWLSKQHVEQSIDTLHNLWKKHGEFSRHPSWLIEQLYEEVIPTLQYHAEKAKKELNSKKRRIPKPIFDYIEERVLSILSEIELIKIQLLHAMQARLMVTAMTGDAACDDVTKCWYDIIFSLVPDTSPQKSLYFQPRRGLTPELYNQFSQHLAQHPDIRETYTDSLNNFMKLNHNHHWLNPGERYLCLTCLNRRGMDIAVPTHFEHVVPSWPGFQWLMPGRYLRYYFFQRQRRFLVHSIQNLPQVNKENVDTNHLTSLSSLQRLLAISMLLKKDFGSLDDIRLHPFFQAFTLAFLGSWRKLIIQTGAKIIEKQIALLNLISNKLLSQKENEISKDDAMMIKKLIMSIQINIGLYGLERRRYQHFIRMKADIQKLLDNTQNDDNKTNDPVVGETSIHCAAITLTQSLIAGHLLEPHLLHQVIQYAKIQKDKPNSILHIQIVSALNKAVRIIEYELTRSPLKLSDRMLEQHIKTISTYLTFWSHLNGVYENHQALHLQTRLYHYLQHYFSTLANAPFSLITSDRFASLDRLLLKFGDNLIREQINKIHTLRMRKAAPALIKIQIRTASHAFYQIAGRTPHHNMLITKNKGA